MRTHIQLGETKSECRNSESRQHPRLDHALIGCRRPIAVTHVIFDAGDGASERNRRALFPANSLRAVSDQVEAVGSTDTALTNGANRASFVLNPAYSTSLCNEQRKFQHGTKEAMSAATSHFNMYSATGPVDVGPKDRRCWKIHDPSEVLKQCVCCDRGDFGSWRRTHRFVKLANFPTLITGLSVPTTTAAMGLVCLPHVRRPI